MVIGLNLFKNKSSKPSINKIGKMNLKSILLLLVIAFTACKKNDDEPNKDIEIQKGKISASIQVKGVKRDYIVYIPQSYSGEEAVPLLFAFHGFGGNMEASYNNSKFYEIAEKENVIVVHPNGISSQWNAVSASNNADITFVEELIIELQNKYNIDKNRIYSCGMSNGGYFSFLLACELSDKIAGIASVTGLMFENVLTNCTPTRPIPILQIHGTEDNVVDYSGVNDVLTFWIDHNNTVTTPSVTDVPNIAIADGSTVERFVYDNGTNNVAIHHFKITGGKHKWPGYEGNMDINASEEIWNFLKQYDINGKIE